MKIAFLVWNRFMLLHFLPLAKQFKEPDIIFFEREGGRAEKRDLELLEAAGAYFRTATEADLDVVANFYDVVVSTYVPLTRYPIKARLVIMQYGLAKAANQFDGRWAAADLGLVYGRFSSTALSSLCPVVEVGNPRFDDYFNGQLDQNILDSIRRRLDPSKKTLMYSPTWGDLSSIPKFEKSIIGLLDRYNIIFNYHHLSSSRDKLGKVLVTGSAIFADDFDYAVDYIPYFLSVCDLVLSDMSGAIFDALYCGRRVLLLDNGFDPSMTHKKARTDSPEYLLRSGVCAFVESPEGLYASVETELALSDTLCSGFEISRYFSVKGQGAEVARDAILGLVDGVIGRASICRQSVADVRSLMAIRARAIHRSREPSEAKIASFSRALLGRPSYWSKGLGSALNLLSVFSRKIDTTLSLMFLFLAKLTGARWLINLLAWKTKGRVIVRVANYLAREYARRENYAEATSLLQRCIGRRGYKPKLHGSYALRAKDANTLVKICEYLASRRSVDIALLFDLASHCRFSRQVSVGIFQSKLNALSSGLAMGAVGRRAEKLAIEIGAFSLIRRDSHFFNAWCCKRLWEVTECRLLIFDTALKNSISLNGGWSCLSGDYQVIEFGEEAIEVFIPRSLLITFSSESVLRNQLYTAKMVFSMIDVLLSAGKKVFPRLQGHWGSDAPLSAPFFCGANSITWHTESQGFSKRLNVKYGTLPGYFSLDPSGYAGFSQYSKLGPRRIVSSALANQFYENIRSEIVDTRISKYKQSTGGGGVKFRNYIFFPLQIVTDSVAVLRFANPMDYLVELVKWAESNNYGVVIKRHPKCRNVEVQRSLRSIREHPHVQVVNGDIHEIISGCDAVFTINSGVGAEALLHLKPVLLGGVADYRWGGEDVVSPPLLQKALDRIVLKRCGRSEDDIKKFLYSYTHEYMVRCDDEESIAKVLHDFGFIDAVPHNIGCSKSVVV